MGLFKSSKNKSASVATSPSATPRASMQDQRLALAKMTQEQALEILLRKTMADAASGPYLQAIQDRMSKMSSQAFRARFSSEIIAIPTRHDTKCGQRVVRWKDIQQCFENAKYIMNGGEAVLFLTDDDLDE
ncbi:hypothetical protein BGZ65_001973 [Modicella reniformis]|uniref:Uncharacterized protein n=1 Tax=Modicella reniformis TaxID=1440133 RepID=A0A9P6ILA3_9FUNG|nr:hypothetical protein BGZ65_001973 [Modicella reniformis]